MTLKFVSIIVLSAGIVLSGCNRDGRESGTTLLNIRSQGVPPDEFLVLPRNPLVRPSDLSALPEPTPGGANIADPDVFAPMMAALGARAPRGGISGTEAPLVRAVGGAQGNVRATLAAENAEFLAQNANRLERRSRQLRGNSIYSGMLLDPFAEAERLRALGVKVPNAPPQ